MAEDEGDGGGWATGEGPQPLGDVGDAAAAQQGEAEVAESYRRCSTRAPPIPHASSFGRRTSAWLVRCDTRCLELRWASCI